MNELMNQTELPGTGLPPSLSFFFLDCARVVAWWIQYWIIDVYCQRPLGHTMEISKLELHQSGKAWRQLGHQIEGLWYLHDARVQRQAQKLKGADRLQQ